MDHGDNIDIDPVRTTVTHNGVDNLCDIEFVYTIDEFNRCVLLEYGPFKNGTPVRINQGDAAKDLGERQSDGLDCGDEEPADGSMDGQFVEGDEGNTVGVSRKVIEEDVRDIEEEVDFETLEVVQSTASSDEDDNAFQSGPGFGSPLSFGSTDCHELEYVDSVEYEYEEKENSRSSSRQDGRITSSPSLEESSFEMLDANGVQFCQRHLAKSDSDWEGGEEEDAEKDEMEVYNALMIEDDDGKDEDNAVVVDASEKSIITSKGLLTTVPSTLSSSVPQNQSQNRNQHDEIIQSQTVRIAILESSLKETNSRLSTEIASNGVKIKRLRGLLEETVVYRDEVEREFALLRIRMMGEIGRGNAKEKEEGEKTEREEKEDVREKEDEEQKDEEEEEVGRWVREVEERDGRVKRLEVEVREMWESLLIQRGGFGGRGEKDAEGRSRDDESKETPGSESRWCERNGSLEKELAKMKEEREGLKERIKEWERCLEALEAVLETEREEKETLKEQVKQREERLKALEVVLKMEREEREGLKEQIKEREERLQVSEAVLKTEREEREKEDEESGTRMTRIRLEERISFMEHDIAVKVSTINVLTGQLENAGKQVDDYKAILEAKVKNIQSLEREMREMKISLKEKDKKLERRRWEKRELKQQVDVLKKEVEKEKANNESCRVQLKVVRDETSGLREKLGTAEENIKKWVAASKMKDGELLAVNKRHQKLSRQMELKSQALEAMTAQAREAEDRGAQYVVKMDLYVANMQKNWEAKVAKKSQEAESWRNKLVTVQAQLARQTHELKKLKEDVLGRERRRERYRAERNELREKNQTLESRLAGYQQSCQR